jgi:hypothetical protein
MSRPIHVDELVTVACSPEVARTARRGLRGDLERLRELLEER